MKVLIARMCLGHTERSEVGTWIGHCYRDVNLHPELGIELNDCIVDCAGTHVARNWAVKNARDIGADVLFMVDHDNGPHRDWFLFACKFMKDHPAAVVASPYCSARPFQINQPDRQVNVTVRDALHPHGSRYITRDEAAELTGVQPAYGVPTGVMALGLPLFDKLPSPWFEYRYLNAEKTQAGTEDFYFSEHAVNAGIDVFVAWDHWADHYKIERVGRPQKGEQSVSQSSSEYDNEWEHADDLTVFHLDARNLAIQKREAEGYRVVSCCAIPITSVPDADRQGNAVEKAPVMAFSIIYVRKRKKSSPPTQGETISLNGKHAAELPAPIG
jgi:hypothetical protein